MRHHVLLRTIPATVVPTRGTTRKSVGLLRGVNG